MLSEISRCYKELEKFWTEEIGRAVTALQTRRVDPSEAERWRDFKTELQQTIESWEVWSLTSLVYRKLTNLSD